MRGGGRTVPVQQAALRANTLARRLPTAAGWSIPPGPPRANPIVEMRPYFQTEKPDRSLADERRPNPRVEAERIVARQPKCFQKRQRRRVKRENARGRKGAPCLLHCNRRRGAFRAGCADRVWNDEPKT